MEEKHFKGIFAMFAVVAVFLGALVALNLTGFGIFNFLKASNPDNSGDSVNITCNDSDGGVNLETYGICTDSTGSYSDSCINNTNGTLSEYYCVQNSFCAHTEYNCFAYNYTKCGGGKCYNPGGGGGQRPVNEVTYQGVLNMFNNCKLRRNWPAPGNNKTSCNTYCNRYNDTCVIGGYCRGKFCNGGLITCDDLVYGGSTGNYNYSDCICCKADFTGPGWRT